MLFKKIIFLLTVCFANCFSFAQPAKNESVEYNYQCIPWGTDQGLSVGGITSMLKDRYGFLWIGTNAALNRFDGSHFVNYYPDKNKSGTINSGDIHGLIQDSLGNMWIGTRMGLSRYDNKTDTFSNFSFPHNPASGFAFIIPFWATRDEVFCIEMSSQVTAYNVHSFKKRIVVNHFDNNLGNKLSRYGYSIIDTRANSVWMLDKDVGLLEVSLISGKQIQYVYAPKRVTTGDDYMKAMCYDGKRNLIWLNTNDGLIQFSLVDKKFICIDAFKGIMSSTQYRSSPGIGLDPQGCVWITTMFNGVLIFDPAKQVGRQFVLNSKRSNKEIPGFTWFIYCDPDGIVWSGNGDAMKPIDQFNPIRASVFRYIADTAKAWSLSHKWVSSIVNGPQSKLWIGTWDGLDIFDPITGLFKVLREKDLPGFKGKNIIPVVVDTFQQKAWIKAWAPDAMFEMDIRTRKCRKLTIHDTTFNQRLTWDIEAEVVRPFHKGIIFPINGEGIFSVKKDSLVAHQEIAISQVVQGMIVADDRLLFLKLYGAHKNCTYTYLKGKWTPTPNPLDDIEWSNIFYNEKDQTFWVGALREITHYDKEFRTIRRYAEGFPGVDVLSIQADDNGNIWCTNEVGGISRLNPETGKFIALSEKDGFQKQKYRWNHPTVKDQWGDLYFAGADGIDRIRPDRLKESYPPSSVYIQSIEVNQKLFSLAEGANHLRELSLNYDENSITIETGSLDYYSEGGSRIRYKLEGVNGNWRYAPNHYNLRFDGLSPGKYRLVIQASNAVDDFSGPEKTLLIKIIPAFWNTWWFYVLVGMGVTTGIYILFRDRLQQKINLLEMRNQISQDLHDEIGGSISGINLLSQMASEKLQNNELEEASVYLFKVKNYTQDVIEKLSDTVWIFNPQNDSIQKLLQRLKSFAISIALSKNIKIHFETDKESETINLTIRERKAVYLISKEALNNIFKYAACCNIYYSLCFKVSKWQLIIKDDGKGFIPAENQNGNGLRNMKARADEIGANFDIQSQSDAGTIITVEF